MLLKSWAMPLDRVPMREDANAMDSLRLEGDRQSG
jgi:hypothetical protein